MSGSRSVSAWIKVDLRLAWVGCAIPLSGQAIKNGSVKDGNIGFGYWEFVGAGDFI